MSNPGTQILYYDRNGNPIDIDTVTGSDDQWRVAQTTINDKIWVSTVHLRINHNFGDGPPLIFETMVFDDDNDSEVIARYATEWEAVLGHVKTVERLQAEINE